MAVSMTGCGEGVASEGGSTCRVELRGVNNKHFKFSLRALPRSNPGSRPRSAAASGAAPCR